MIHRITEKGRQLRSYFKDSSTPLALILDALRLKRSPFIAATKDGFKLSLEPSVGEGFTFYENLIRKDYLSRGIVLKPGDTVMDIGANIGSFSILAGSVVGPGGRVIAFEPVPATYQRLVQNLELNGLKNVECHNAAIDAEEGELTIHLSRKSAMASAYWDPHEGGGVVTAPCWTLAKVWGDFGIGRVNLFKIDCEGSEYGIFDSISPELAARIDQIAMEIHPDPAKGNTADRLRRRLEDLGFEVHPGMLWMAFNKSSDRRPASP
ncbi:FkbM family methyltransferase [Aquisphaera insulae]|uniref:FkbM family methyltransferase n=1 Tax=Aquisphaera insulae TaxID=2712864 RepID=UPI0013ECAE81|nr:FkbM family methyltransferase [Aquisphaera insulae]